MMFERSHDHLILHALMSKVEPGTLIDYGEMSTACGRPVTGSFGPLRSVLNRLLNEDGIVYENERMIGYRRLTAEQTIDTAEGDRQRMHRLAHRKSTRLSTVDADYMTLDEAHRLRYVTRLSLFQAITAATTARALKLIEKHVGSSSTPLPFHETLQAFVTRK